MNRLLIAALATGALFGQAVNPDRRLEHATETLRAFLSSDSSVSRDFAANAQCIIVAPGLMKGAALVGAKYGRGFASCRKANAAWTSPAAVAIEGAKLGSQTGGSTTDLIMLVMNASGMKRLLGDKFTLGGDASIAAGPLTANADTDLKTEIIAYSRTKDSFAGVLLEGATLRPDAGENKKLYGHEFTNGEILSGKTTLPKGAKDFVAVLNKRARKAK